MNSQHLEDLLSYHQPLQDAAFKQQIINHIDAKEKKRSLIMWVFSLVGLLCSGLYLWSVLPVGILQDVLTPINGLLLSGIGLFVVWLWTEALADG